MLPSLKSRNLFLLGACGWFYAAASPINLLILAAVTVTAYYCPIISRGQTTISFSAGSSSGAVLSYSSIIPVISVTGIISLLIFAKSSGLPVAGISFYSFQAIAYIADTSRGETEIERNPVRFALFMSFFPQLTAGPIERAHDLIPQFSEKRNFSYNDFRVGFPIILWGYFLKTVLADRCGMYVDAVYSGLENHNGVSCALASILFSFQIYGDFAGYSLIAIGTARLLGFRLTENFRTPYLSSSVTEFWNRWHITLSRWLRDYVYIPLGGNRKGNRRTLMNLMAVMTVSALWHGMDVTFIIWGVLHGTALVAERLSKTRKSAVSNGFTRMIKIAATFLFITFAWIFFRSPDLHTSLLLIHKISMSAFNLITGSAESPFLPIADLAAVAVALAILPLGNWIRTLCNRGTLPFAFSCSLLIVIILALGVLSGGSFIYFTF